MYSLSYFNRSAPFNHAVRSKVIGKRKLIINLENHYISKYVKGKFERKVNSNEALLYHYREQSIAKTHNYKDTTAIKYAAELSKNVDEVCRRVYSYGKCMSYDRDTIARFQKEKLAKHEKEISDDLKLD